jgi:hypothetical protein
VAEFRWYKPIHHKTATEIERRRQIERIISQRMTTAADGIDDYSETLAAHWGPALCWKRHKKRAWRRSPEIATLVESILIRWWINTDCFYDKHTKLFFRVYNRRIFLYKVNVVYGVTSAQRFWDASFFRSVSRNTNPCCQVHNDPSPSAKQTRTHPLPGTRSLF